MPSRAMCAALSTPAGPPPTIATLLPSITCRVTTSAVASVAPAATDAVRIGFRPGGHRGVSGFYWQSLTCMMHACMHASLWASSTRCAAEQHSPSPHDRCVEVCGSRSLPPATALTSHHLLRTCSARQNVGTAGTAAACWCCYPGMRASTTSYPGRWAEHVGMNPRMKAAQSSVSASCWVIMAMPIQRRGGLSAMLVPREWWQRCIVCGIVCGMQPVPHVSRGGRVRCRWCVLASILFRLSARLVLVCLAAVEGARRGISLLARKPRVRERDFREPGAFSKTAGVHETALWSHVTCAGVSCAGWVMRTAGCHDQRCVLQ